VRRSGLARLVERVQVAQKQNEKFRIKSKTSQNVLLFSSF
jgi:hypothetical protein